MKRCTASSLEVTSITIRTFEIFSDGTKREREISLDSPVALMELEKARKDFREKRGAWALPE